MTSPDRRLERPLEPPEAPHENVQDVVPRTERNQDPGLSMHDLVTDTSRPLTDEERKAADRDAPVAERVFAPASERVPREPVPGHRDFVEHPDTATPERQAAGQTTTSTMSEPMSEPSFTRVPRPSSNGDQPQASRWMSNAPSGASPLVPLGIGWIVLSVAGGVGIWLWMRWRREQNKPINRLRRQAQQARQRAYQLRDRMPDVEMPDEAARPAIGLGTALVSLAILLWQQSQSRSRAQEMQSRAHKAQGRALKAAEKGRRQAARGSRQAAQSLSDIDWQERLMQLKDLWSARRVELEKISVTKK